MRTSKVKHEHIVGFDKTNVLYEDSVKIVYINDYIDRLKVEPPQIVQNFCSVCGQKVNMKRINMLCRKNKLELNRRRRERLSNPNNTVCL